MVPALSHPLTAVPVGFQPLSASQVTLGSRAGSVSSKLDILSRPRSAQMKTTPRHPFPSPSSFHPFILFCSPFKVCPGCCTHTHTLLQRHGSASYVCSSGKLSRHSSTKVLPHYTFRPFSFPNFSEKYHQIPSNTRAKWQKGAFGTSSLPQGQPPARTTGNHRF
jgi:hypothetical protein